MTAPPTQTIIHPTAYHMLDAFRAENRNLTKACWWFAGFVRDLDQHHGFVTRNIGDISILVQNFHGELRAFVNTCSHRFCRIHNDAKGIRPLQCPYHGWAYNADGLPVGIPARPHFETLAEQGLDKFRLQQLRVAVCGALVFVAHAEVAESLDDFLGEAGPRIKEWSNACGPLIDVFALKIAANWKLLVENTLESYHVGFVHPQSFASLGLGIGEFRFEGRNSSWWAPAGASVARDWRRLTKLFASRPVQIDGYAHQLIFPNLTLATTWGASFSIQLFEPLDASATQFTSFVFRTKLQSPNENLLQAFDKAIVQFNRKVFEEDRDVCENVQKGILGASTPGVLSTEELRVLEFHREYMRIMESALLTCK
jgi:phenylpropionate dioxygenase-like ring-hydroxylating dioxygenase large terminal subunit